MATVTVAAVVVALLAAAVRSRPSAGPGQRSSTSTPETTAPTVAAAVDELRAGAIDVRPLPGTAERAIFRQCTAAHPEADASRTLDPARLTVVVTAATTGAGVELWRGPAPGFADALGTCVALDRPDGWELVSGSWRGYPEEGDLGLVWQPVALDDGAVASLAGRVGADVATAVVLLRDGRVLEITPAAALVAAAWTPISPPQRLVLVSADGRVTYDGPFLAYER